MAWLGNAFDKFHSIAARSKWSTIAAIKLRNQCNRIIAHRMGFSCKLEANGEGWLIRRLNGSPKVCVDVGANIGDWTAFVLTHNPSIRLAVMFEPDPRSLSVLKARFSDRPQAVIRDEAVGTTAGSTEFYQAVNDEWSSCVKPDGAKISGRLQVRTSTIDQLAAEYQLDEIDMLKIDTEGGDFDVLLGAHDCLRKHKCRVVQFEYNDTWIRAGSTLCRARRFLVELGYSVYLLDREALFDVDAELIGEHFSYSNYVALRPDALTQLQGAVRSRRV
jgi:FkbM family methyltransferase